MSEFKILREDFNDVTTQVRVDCHNFGEMLNRGTDQISFLEDDLIGPDLYSMLVIAKISSQDFSFWTPIVMSGMDAMCYYFKTRGKIACTQIYDLGDEGYEIRTMIGKLTSVECNEMVAGFKPDLKLSELNESTQVYSKAFYSNEQSIEPVTLDELKELTDDLDLED